MIVGCIYYQDGAVRSEFIGTYIEKKLSPISTARNWKTILEMNEMPNE